MFTGQVSVLIGGGGALNSQTFGDLEVFPSQDNCQIPNLQTMISGLTGVIYPSIFQHGKDILLCGGAFNEGECWKLDIKNRKWTHFNSLLNSRNYPASVVSMKNETYILGGSADIRANENLKHSSRNWQQEPYIPGNHLYGGCGVKISDEEILIIGGYSVEERILKFNTSNKTWHNTSIEIPQLRDHSCINHGGKILISGGGDYDVTAMSKTYVLDIGDDGDLKIREVGRMIEARSAHGMGIVKLNNELKVITFGGQGINSNDLNSVEIWNDLNETWSKSSLIIKQPKYGFGYATIPTELLCPNVKLKSNIGNN